MGNQPNIIRCIIYHP